MVITVVKPLSCKEMMSSSALSAHASQAIVMCVGSPIRLFSGFKQEIPFLIRTDLMA